MLSAGSHAFRLAPLCPSANAHTAPGPATGFLQEAVHWYDFWLKGKENGIIEELMLRAWLSPEPVQVDSYPSGCALTIARANPRGTAL